MNKTDIFGLFAEEIAEQIMPLQIEKYRARQIAEWIYRRGIRDFQDMTNLSKECRSKLMEHFVIGAVAVKARQQSQDGSTTKFLLSFSDNAAVETVLMRHDYGNSVCVSTQVGCAMGCAFCASTLGGVTRDLTGGEIFAQVSYIDGLLRQEGQKVDTVVIMGSGEPLANYENVVRFIRLSHEPYALQLGYRNFTLSTSGLAPQIDRLAAEGLPITLAISLHAPNDSLRSELMPVNRRYPIEQLLAAADRYATATGRRVTYEYILISGKNDGINEAKQLAQLLKGRLANVNLIPANPVPERGLLRSPEERVRQFEQMLLSRGITATVRREMGADIQAACGQLRRRILAEQDKNSQIGKI